MTRNGHRGERVMARNGYALAGGPFNWPIHRLDGP